MDGGKCGLQQESRPRAWSEEEEAEEAGGARETGGGEEGMTTALSLRPPLVATGTAPTSGPSLSSQQRSAAR